MRTIEVLQPGSPVMVGDDIQARVIGVSIYDRDIEYQVVWWDGRNRRVEWVKQIEVSQPDETQTVKLGFT